MQPFWGLHGSSDIDRRQLHCREQSGWEVGLVLYPDPDSRSCGWITSPLRGKSSGDVIHPQLRESGSGYETKVGPRPTRSK